MALRCLPGIALSWSWLLSGSVAAQAEAVARYDDAVPAVVVVRAQCEAVPHEELRKLIALELAPREVRAIDRAPARSEPTRAMVTCSDTEARLWVEDAVRDRRQALTVDLAAVPTAARARLLALTLSELVATLALEGAPHVDRAARDSPGEPAVEARASVREPVVEVPRAQTSSARPTRAARGGTQRAWLGAGIAREGRPAMLMPSLQTGITAASARWPVAGLSELQLHRGARSVSAGEVVSWTVSGAAAVAGQLTTAWVELTLGLGLRLGYAHLRGDVRSGEAGSGRTVSGLWWGPTAFVGAVLPTRQRWGVRCGLDVGHVARDVRGLDGAGRRSYSLEGLQLQANVGVSLALSKARGSRD